LAPMASSTSWPRASALRVAALRGSGPSTDDGQGLATTSKAVNRVDPVSGSNVPRRSQYPESRWLRCSC
jgi:hypothetical protein